jgi:hypothetical protein
LRWFNIYLCAHNNQSTLSAPLNKVSDTFDATWAVPDGSTSIRLTLLFRWSVPIRDYRLRGPVACQPDDRHSSRLAPIQPLIFRGNRCKRRSVAPVRTLVVSPVSPFHKPDQVGWVPAAVHTIVIRPHTNSTTSITCSLWVLNAATDDNKSLKWYNVLQGS